MDIAASSGVSSSLVFVGSTSPSSLSCPAISSHHAFHTHTTSTPTFSAAVSLSFLAPILNVSDPDFESGSGSKIVLYLLLGLHKGRPSSRRSLQPSKENIQHFKTRNFLTFFYFSGSFLPPGSGSGFQVRIHSPTLILIHSGSGPETLPIIPFSESHYFTIHIFGCILSIAFGKFRKFIDALHH
jgi:hypothetical protein